MHMHILMYRWKAYNYRDIEQTFRLLGHTVDNIEQKLGNYDIDPEFEKKIERMMEENHYDFVFTVNYFARFHKFHHHFSKEYLPLHG